jgi:hypothetical protein
LPKNQAVDATGGLGIASASAVRWTGDSKDVVGRCDGNEHQNSTWKPDRPFLTMLQSWRWVLVVDQLAAGNVGIPTLASYSLAVPSVEKSLL